jgi:hypothetical protein
LVVANGSAVDTETVSRTSATATWSALASPGSGSHRKYDDGCPMSSSPSRTLRASLSHRVGLHRRRPSVFPLSTQDQRGIPASSSVP